MAVVLLLAGMTMSPSANTPQPHKTTNPVASQIRPVCDFVPMGKEVPPTRSQAASVEPVSPESGTQTPPLTTS